jgi:hypothetical protein
MSCQRESHQTVHSVGLPYQRLETCFMPLLQDSLSSGALACMSGLCYTAAECTYDNDMSGDMSGFECSDAQMLKVFKCKLSYTCFTEIKVRSLRRGTKTFHCEYPKMS